MRQLLAAACRARRVSGAVLAQPDPEAATRQATGAERGFGRSLAERDHAAFMSHLSEQAVFVSGPKVPNRKAAVAAAWERFFDAQDARGVWRLAHRVRQGPNLGDGTPRQMNTFADPPRG